MPLLKELVAKFEKTTKVYALFRHQPETSEDFIIQVYVPRASLNGTIPRGVKVTIADY